MGTQPVSLHFLPGPPPRPHPTVNSQLTLQNARLTIPLPKHSHSYEWTEKILPSWYNNSVLSKYVGYFCTSRKAGCFKQEFVYYAHVMALNKLHTKASLKVPSKQERSGREPFHFSSLSTQWTSLIRFCNARGDFINFTSASCFQKSFLWILTWSVHNVFIC